MCRFVYYQGVPLEISALLTEPEHSLIRQSVHAREREEPLNGDGFGMAWFAEDDPEPALFKSVTPAWSNESLVEMARVIRSDRILAHVRAATQGFTVTELNCHPFRMGGLTLMHNGDLGGFPGYRRALLEGLSDESFHAIRGTTDSEHFLALVHDGWEALGAASPDPAERLRQAMARALGHVTGLQEAVAPEAKLQLNLVVTDGDATVACRYTSDVPERANTLYLQTGHRYLCEEGIPRLEPAPEGASSVIVASEPLTRDAGWSPVAPGEALLIDADHSVRRRPFGPIRA